MYEITVKMAKITRQTFFNKKSRSLRRIHGTIHSNAVFTNTALTSDFHSVSTPSPRVISNHWLEN